MERTGVLIERLLQQYNDNADAALMLITVQLLAAELQQQVSAAPGTGKKVSVVIPSFVSNATRNTGQPSAAAEEKLQVIKEPAPALPVPEKPILQSTPAPLPVIIPAQPPRYDPVIEIPTLAHQPHNKAELNEMIGSRGDSLNERLRTNNVELGAVLQTSPVKDLKRAIGINDRYVFINELFRGDEVMYERSIKTINSFTILAEAEYWIKRELKLKLSWNDDVEAVKSFDQLVKRRFS